MTRLREGLFLLALAAALACGKSQRNEMPASRRGGPVSKAKDDIPSVAKTEIYVDHYRFGDVTDTDGIVVRERSLIPPGSTAAMSFYVRNVHAGTEVRVVWKDVGKNVEMGSETKPAGDKGFVAFKQPKPFSEGSYRVSMYYKQPSSKVWEYLGYHDFIIGAKT